MRFYQTDGTTVGLYARAGMLSTTSTSSGARIDIDGATDTIGIYGATQPSVILDPTNGLRLFDTGGVARVILTTTGGLRTTTNTATGILNAAGLGFYNSAATFDATTQTFFVSGVDGKLTVGNPTGIHMEATRTALGFYSSTNTLQLSLGASGGLTTQAAESSQRVTLSSAGLASYNTSGLQTVLIDAATGKIIIGPPSAAARIEADRTSMTFYQADGLTAGLTVTAGKVVSNTSPSVARIEFDGILNQFSAYDTVRQRLSIDGTNGLRVWDAAGVLGLTSSAGGLVTGTGANRAELLADGLTLYQNNQQSLKLDTATGKMIAGASSTGQRIELDVFGFSMYDSTNTLGVHSTTNGWSTGVAPDGRVEMDSLGLRAINPAGAKTFEIFASGAPSRFSGTINADGGITQPVVSDGLIGASNKHAWMNSAGAEIAYIGAAAAAGSDQYSTAILATSGLRNYWRLGEGAGTVLADTKGLSTLSGLTGTYTMGRPSLVLNETGNLSLQFSGAGGRAGSTVWFSQDGLGSPAGALNGRTATYGGVWATSGSATTPDYVINSTAFAGQYGAVRTAASETTGRIALLGTTNFDDVKLTMQMMFEWVNDTGTLEMGFVARYVDANNYVKAIYSRASDNGQRYHTKVVKVVGGTPTTLVDGTSITNWPAGTYNSSPPTLTIDTAGNVSFTINEYADAPVVVIQDPDLKAGGVLATGKVGIWDMLTGVGAGNKSRIYWGFKASSPARNFTPKTWTMEAWVNPTTVDATDRVIMEAAPGSAYPYTAYTAWRITQSTAGIKLYYANNAGFWTAGATGGILPQGVISHIAVHWAANSGGMLQRKFRVYINGVETLSVDNSAAANVYGDGLAIATIGAARDGTQPFLGTIDEVAFYPSEIPAAQIKEHYDIGAATGVPDVELRVKVQAPGLPAYERILLDQNGFSNIGPRVSQTYTVSGAYTKDRAFNPLATTVGEMAAVLATLIDDLKTATLLQ